MAFLNSYSVGDIDQDPEESTFPIIVIGPHTLHRSKLSNSVTVSIELLDEIENDNFQLKLVSILTHTYNKYDIDGFSKTTHTVVHGLEKNHDLCITWDSYAFSDRVENAFIEIVENAPASYCNSPVKYDGYRIKVPLEYDKLMLLVNWGLPTSPLDKDKVIFDFKMDLDEGVILECIEGNLVVTLPKKAE